MKVNGFDIDGVIHLGGGKCGVRPGPNDIIITGRSHEEEPETKAFLEKHGIKNTVHFNPVPFKAKSRQQAGIHKGRTLNWLKEIKGIDVEFFFEDDEVQKAEMEKACEWLKVIHVYHDFTEKENVRHLEDLNAK